MVFVHLHPDGEADRPSVTIAHSGPPRLSRGSTPRRVEFVDHKRKLDIAESTGSKHVNQSTVYILAQMV